MRTEGAGHRPRGGQWVLMAMIVGPLLAGCVGALPQGGGALPETGSAMVPGGLTLIAHRGAWRVYPESSAEAFAAMAETAYPIEFDLRRLSDGTLVPSHDATADRSMQGLTGPLTGISPEQWNAASIRSQDGRSLGTPITWIQILERYGGKAVLVPELKRPVTDLAGFIKPILDRGIQDKVMVQSVDYEACKELAAAGLRTVLVIHDGQPVPAQIRADGIGHVAVSRNHPLSYFSELKDAGLETWVFLVNRAGPLQQYLDRGVVGVYTDDPWKLDQELGDGGPAVTRAS